MAGSLQTFAPKLRDSGCSRKIALEGERLHGVPDAAFADYLLAPAEAISDAAVRFLLCTALKTHILHESVVEPV